MRLEEVSPELRELVFLFFHRFSRLEFALKEAGYLANRNPGAWAIPDWNQFIADWEDRYAPSKSANGLIEAAPQEQVVAADGESLTFRNIEFAPDTNPLVTVVKLLRTVRNNLFHGGKHDAAGWDTHARLEKLLPLSIDVLGDLAILGGVEADFKGAY